MTSLIGQTVSHYKILELLGGGGMGVVYKAEDLALKRAVAVKFLPPELTRDIPSKERFVHEAQAASALEHNNICTVHEIGETPDGQIFIVMAYYEGETLKKRIEEGPLKIEDELKFALQICQGLAKVHEKGIVHRDIKPANVIITSDGDAKILDFGLARLSGRTSLTKAGWTLGTVDYMSPEQAQGIEVDARSDLFSLGVVLYEMATGRRPFLGEHEPALIYCILNADPPPPSSINHGISPGLEAVILKLLEKVPAKRYQTALDLRSDLMLLSAEIGTSGTSSVRTRRHVSRRISKYVGAAVLLAFVAWLVSPGFHPAASTKPPWRIGILPFKLITQRPEVGDWPRVVQMIMVDHLNGIEELRIIDPFSLSSLVSGASAESPSTLVFARQIGASYLVNGTIERLDTTYVIRCTLTDVADGSVKMSDAESSASERELPRTVQNISEQILNYFQIQTLSGGGRVNEDLRPWLNHRTKKLDAIKAFLQGAQFRLRWQPGGERFFRKAIELDSTFVTPRTWLISGLVNGGGLAEAKEHQALLVRHMFDAGPFEQALIRWTGAMIEGNKPAQAKALEEALEYSPNNDVLLYLLADIRYSEEDYAAATRTIRPAVEAGWNFQPASLLLGTSLFQLREYSQSRQVLEHSLNLETVVPETYAILAALALHDGEPEVSDGYAQEFFRRAQNERASSDSLYALLGDYCASIRMYKPASEYYSKAIDLNPGRAKYRLGLARSAFELGDLTRAQEVTMHALDLDSTSLQVHDLMGRVFEAKGDTPAALRHFLTYSARDSTSARSTEIRGRTNELTRK